MLSRYTVVNFNNLHIHIYLPQESECSCLCGFLPLSKHSMMFSYDLLTNISKIPNRRFQSDMRSDDFQVVERMRKICGSRNLQTSSKTVQFLFSNPIGEKFCIYRYARCIVPLIADREYCALRYEGIRIKSCRNVKSTFNCRQYILKKAKLTIAAPFDGDRKYALKICSLRFIEYLWNFNDEQTDPTDGQAHAHASPMVGKREIRLFMFVDGDPLRTGIHKRRETARRRTEKNPVLNRQSTSQRKLENVPHLV